MVAIALAFAASAAVVSALGLAVRLESAGTPAPERGLLA